MVSEDTFNQYEMYCEGKLKLMSHNTGRYTLYPGADRGFQVRGGGAKFVGVFRVKNHDFQF